MGNEGKDQPPQSPYALDDEDPIETLMPASPTTGGEPVMFVDEETGELFILDHGGAPVIPNTPGAANEFLDNEPLIPTGINSEPKPEP